jgi:hypothetical protein
VPIILPLDPRGSTALEGHGNHKGHGGAGPQDRPFQAFDRGREGLRGEVQAVNSDERPVHFVGHLAAPEVVPWEIARFGPHV